MRIWQGRTPTGYALVVERDERNRWVATVAAASRSRNESLEAALIEAGGTTITRVWAERLAAVILARTALVADAAQNGGGSHHT
jgi:hypothetical protein